MGKFHILAILISLSSALFADQLGEELASFGSLLDANITMQGAQLLQSPQVVDVSIEAKNPYSQPMPVYVIRNRGFGWEVVRLVGALEPSSGNEIALEIEVNYEKLSQKSTRYAVVARAEDGELYGKYFDIDEDWRQYEKGIQEALSYAMNTVVPIAGALLVVLVAAVAKVAYRSKSPGLDESEYTMKSIVFPEVEGRPFEEKVADLLIHPLIMFLEVGCLGLLVFMMHESLVQGGQPGDAMGLVVLSGIGSFMVPFLYFAAAWYFEKREEKKPLRFFMGIFIWGIFAAFLSLVVSSWLFGQLQAYELAPYAPVIAIMLIAPIVEEVMKGIGVLAVSGHHEYNDTLTGLLIGFTAGVGFAFVENWFYFSSKTNPFDVGLGTWVMLVLYRSFFNSLAHGCFTAMISAPIGYLRSIPSLRRYARLAFVPGVFLAVAVHSAFNLSALADGFAVANREVPFYLFNPMFIILLAALFFLVLVLATIDEKKRKVQLASPTVSSTASQLRIAEKEKKGNTKLAKAG